MTASWDRPSWSVMIPTFEPRLDYLTETVRGVLDQDWSGVDVQIELVDDRSEEFDVADFVRGLGDPRVTSHRRPEHRGLAGNWNQCIARARGSWVHILHQDDLVHSGFYQRLEEGIRRAPTIGAAFSQGFVIDDEGARRRHTCRVSQREPGLLDDWVQHVFVELAIQTPTIAVRRDIYEDLGGFDARLQYTLDWEMWKRIAVRYPIWFDPAPLASYRVHGDSATRALQRTGENLNEIRANIEDSATLLPEALAEEVLRGARDHYAKHAVSVAWDALRTRRDTSTAWAQLQGARGLVSGVRLIRLVWEMAVGRFGRDGYDPVQVE